MILEILSALPCDITQFILCHEKVHESPIKKTTIKTDNKYNKNEIKCSHNK